MENTMKKEPIKQRFLLVSDMHYTTQESTKELKEIYPESNTSLAAGNIFGHPQREKIEAVYQAIMDEYNEAPLDAVLVLGDLSIDDYDYRKLPHNYCEKFKEDCMDRLPCPAYAQPGNHDSHLNETWREVFGYDREFTVTFGDTVFLMADTFKKVPASGASGAPYNPIDPELVKKTLEEYKGKNIFICAHHVGTNEGESELAQLIRENSELKCLFRGHTHHNAVIDLGEAYGNKKLVDIGGYGYNGMVLDGKYTFSVYDHKWAWGYEILEIGETKAYLRHIKPAYHYEGSNGTFDPERTVSGEIEIRL